MRNAQAKRLLETLRLELKNLANGMEPGWNHKALILTETIFGPKSTEAENFLKLQIHSKPIRAFTPDQHQTLDAERLMQIRNADEFVKTCISSLDFKQVYKEEKPNILYRVSDKWLAAGVTVIVALIGAAFIYLIQIKNDRYDLLKSQYDKLHNDNEVLKKQYSRAVILHPNANTVGDSLPITSSN